MLKRVLNKIRQIIWQCQHKVWQKRLRTRFHGKQPTIISNNCTGGIIYHDLGLQFTSPTINLYMSCPDYIRFLEHLEYYLALTITPYRGDIRRDYPMGTLGDLTLFFVHYHSFEEACAKWQQRVQRVDRENLYIIATDRDGYTPEILQRFNALPYAHKKLFTHLPTENPDCVYIAGFENEGQVGGLKRVIDQFDYVSWFNKDI